MTILNTTQVNNEGFWILFLMLGFVGAIAVIISIITAITDKDVKMIPGSILCIFVTMFLFFLAETARTEHTEIECMFDDDYPIVNILDKYSIKEVNGKIVTLIPKEDE